jgi:hypothetical protein
MTDLVRRESQERVRPRGDLRPVAGIFGDAPMNGRQSAVTVATRNGFKRSGSRPAMSLTDACFRRATCGLSQRVVGDGATRFAPAW